MKNNSINIAFRKKPNAWRVKAEQLMASMRVMNSGYNEIQNRVASERREESLGETFECNAATWTGLMLAGFAFENAFKAWYLSSGGTLYGADSKMNKFHSHAYSRWVSATDNFPQLDAVEEDALKKAEFVCRSWGRYPFSNQKELLQNDENTSWDEVDVLIALIQRTLDLVS